VAVGSPNGEDRQLNFVPKVYDPKSKTYKPLYIAPEATDQVLGDVLLSDATDSTLSAATGTTAASPAAVKAVQDNANNKLDKVTETAQKVNAEVTFANKITASSGITGDLTGNVTGTADKAKALSSGAKINVKAGSNGTAGSAVFTGESDVTITIPDIDATKLTGTVPLANLPQGALERVIHVENQEARYALTVDDVQLGDTVIQDNTGVMYIVVDEDKLNAKEGYAEYSAGHATTAFQMVDIYGDTVSAGDQYGQLMYFSNGQPLESHPNIGWDNRPVYVSLGRIRECSHLLGSDVPTPAADGSEADKFLQADGTWGDAVHVTGDTMTGALVIEDKENDGWWPSEALLTLTSDATNFDEGGNTTGEGPTSMSLGGSLIQSYSQEDNKTPGSLYLNPDNTGTNRNGGRVFIGRQWDSSFQAPDISGDIINFSAVTIDKGGGTYIPKSLTLGGFGRGSEEGLGSTGLLLSESTIQSVTYYDETLSSNSNNSTLYLNPKGGSIEIGGQSKSSGNGLISTMEVYPVDVDHIGDWNTTGTITGSALNSSSLYSGTSSAPTKLTLNTYGGDVNIPQSSLIFGSNAKSEGLLTINKPKANTDPDDLLTQVSGSCTINYTNEYASGVLNFVVKGSSDSGSTSPSIDNGHINLIAHHVNIYEDENYTSLGTLNTRKVTTTLPQTVQVSSTEPTEPGVAIWIKTTAEDAVYVDTTTYPDTTLYVNS
jgi:hypothetical protein